MVVMTRNLSSEAVSSLKTDFHNPIAHSFIYTSKASFMTSFTFFSKKSRLSISARKTHLLRTGLTQ